MINNRWQTEERHLLYIKTGKMVKFHPEIKVEQYNSPYCDPLFMVNCFDLLLVSVLHNHYRCSPKIIKVSCPSRHRLLTTIPSLPCVSLCIVRTGHMYMCVATICASVKVYLTNSAVLPLRK